MKESKMSQTRRFIPKQTLSNFTPVTYGAGLSHKVFHHTWLMAFFIILLSGCELIKPIQSQGGESTQHSDNGYFGNYYLWIKNLSDVELKSEISHQQSQQKLGDEYANIYLAIIHSLANSPIYNPYTAKSILNEQALDPEHMLFNMPDFAFIILLKDSLNKQLLALNKLIVKEQLLEEANKQFSSYQLSIENLEISSEKLKEQIKQLKAIEARINDQGS